ncbi:Protein of unknown function DUF1442 [Dillenia turbinata]|uniref:Uncharacterized protein n=1 Tax=Dillenia turbinata TaxID=194707 RepID=A0AAN8UVR6_9MAGN
MAKKQPAQERPRAMKLVWCPESAVKAYLDTVALCKQLKESGEAEIISAMAGGWNSRLNIEAWSHGSSTIAISIGLATASQHTHGRHVCIVPDEQTRAAYTKAMHDAGISPPPEVMVGKAEEVMAGLQGVEFLVVDFQGMDYLLVLKHARLSQRGTVVVGINACERSSIGGSIRWHHILEKGPTVIRSKLLPIGKGMEITHIANRRTNSLNNCTSRWIRHVDQQSGKEHVFRA